MSNFTPYHGKLLREQRKAAGLCTRCGAEAVAGRTLCHLCREKSRQYNKEVYGFRKGLGVCVRCGKRSRFGNFVLCELCLEHQAQYDVTNREYKLEAQRSRFQSRRTAGLCVLCGKVNNNSGQTCSACVQRYKHTRQRYYRAHHILSPLNKHREWIKSGRCAICGADKMNDTKVCRRCYAYLSENIKKAQEATRQGRGEMTP